MYYKITNKNCQVYKKLHEMRSKELIYEVENKKSIIDKTGYNFEIFNGRYGQRNFSRVTTYDGFAFINPENVNLKIWKEKIENVEGNTISVYYPNKQTKLGREMQEYLWNGLKKSNFNSVFNTLNIDAIGSFSFPIVEIVNDMLILFLDQKHEPNDKNVIEITKKEFHEYWGV